MKYILFIITLSALKFNAQIVILNAYAKVSAINAGATNFTVTNVNEASHTFTVGGKIIVMQMQDDVIGTNTTNISTFGDLGSISNAGNYEIRTISACSPAIGTPTNITVSQALTNTFNTGINSSVQLITFRDMGTNFSTTAHITGLTWDGNVGGVIAFEVGNMLTLNFNTFANAIGFSGGARSNDNGGPICDAANPLRYMENQVNLGWKGEGIYKNTNVNFNNGRGKNLNGGGGGSDHNAGGGGGGNYSSGGQGGNGYFNCSTNPGGGLGGISLLSSISGSRVFMGGGGGGGQQNNAVGSRGGNGGGIILIKAAILATSTVCTGGELRISANGETAGNTGNDGAGGGGAAGSIILQINTFSVSPTCTLVVRANGGNGGNCADGQAHAGGGGGGQGVIIYSATQPTVNVTTITTNGLPGTDDNTGTTSGTSGGGVNNSGILSPQATILPIELLNFDAQEINQIIDLNWRTASEINNDYFIVERSLDAVNFTTLGSVKALNSRNTISNYTFKDINPENGYNYYRLKQVDFDGTYSYSKIISFENFVDFEFSVFPNPLMSNQTLIITLNKFFNTNLELKIFDFTGKQVLNRYIETQNSGKIEIDNINLKSGIYIIRLYNEYSISTKKLVIE